MDGTQIDKPGIFNMSREEYDADLAPAPSLNASVAKILLEKSPQHARLAHPRLCPGYERNDRREFDLGSAVHALMLGEQDKVFEIVADDYRTKAAKEARDAAIALGKLPLLSHQLVLACAMAAAIRRQLDACKEGKGVFLAGRAERSLFWNDDGVWCRGRPDWIPAADGPRICYDLKTTGGSANPDVWVTALWRDHHDIQAAHYLRGLEIITSESWDWRWIVVETSPPFALSIIGMTPAARDLAKRRLREATDLWRECLAANQWPGYPAYVCWADAPPWADARLVERQARQSFAREHGEKIVDTLINWQAPDNWKGIPA